MARTARYFAIAILAALLALSCLAGAALAQETPPEEQVPATEGETTTDTPSGTPPQAPGQTQTQQAPLMVYFFKDGELTGVAREIPGGGQMVEFTVNDLFDGPSEEEQAEGFTTYLPEGLKLLYSTKSMTGNAFSVNLSSELMSLKDTPEQAKMAMQQLVQTLKEAARTDEIKVTVDVDEANRAVDAFEALGLDPGDLGIGSSSGDKDEDSYLWLYILIILAVTMVALVILVPLYYSNRKTAAGLEQEIEEEKARRDAKKK